MELTNKYEQLKAILKDMGKVLVAYSGGVDSTFLLKVAWDVLGDNALGVMGISETVPQDQILEARELADNMGVPFLTITTEELHQEEFARNPANRCFYCKRELFSKLWLEANQRNIYYVLDGSNADDSKDYRPGKAAGTALQVRSPLQEAGLTKEDIRILSNQLGLTTWDKPASPCLSSRFPYGIRITESSLAMVEKAEKYLKTLGFSQLRARYHEDILRIEVDTASIPLILEHREQIVTYMNSIGFRYVTLDLAGYRMGSLNEMLPGKNL